jgi:hypothetical protein
MRFELTRFYKPKDSLRKEAPKSTSRSNADDLISSRKTIANRILVLLRSTGSARALLETAKELGRPLNLDVHVTKARKKEVLKWNKEKLTALVYDRLSLGFIEEAEELMFLLGQEVDFTNTIKKAYADCVRLKIKSCSQIKEDFPDVDFDSIENKI